MPQGRCGEALNRGLAPVEDARHVLHAPLSYEWWYFDASFEDGHQAVAIIWPMNYSKPWRRQCTVQLSIYTPGGGHVKHYLFPRRSRFRASYSRCDVRVSGRGSGRDSVGECWMRGEHPRYEVHVEVDSEALDLVFESQLPGWKPGTSVNLVPFPAFRSMGWLVPAPRAKVSGTLTLGGRSFPVSGHGYHDHNWGEAPIFHSVDNWHWGHVVAGELGLTWADITMQRSLGYRRAYMLLLSKGERLRYESSALETGYLDWCDDRRFLHPYPKTVTVGFGSPGETRGALTMRVREVTETQDLLEMVGITGPPERLVHRLIAKPYYFRWRSDVDGWVELDGRRERFSCETIHEQMLFRGRRPAEMARGA